MISVPLAYAFEFARTKGTATYISMPIINSTDNVTYATGANNTKFYIHSGDSDAAFGAFSQAGSNCTIVGTSGIYNFPLNATEVAHNIVGIYYNGTGCLQQYGVVHFINASVATYGANAVQIGGTAQTGRDLGASVITASGTVTTVSGNVNGNVGGNVNGTVASVTGAVGSVTGNIGGNVNGTVVGSVASVTGAVGSVTGNVGGNVNGTVASVVGAVGSITGNVGGNVNGTVASVVGAVGSVTGNIGGNVNGTVASVTGAVDSVTNDVGITQAGADKVWGTTTRQLTGTQAYNVTGNVLGNVTAVTNPVSLNATIAY